MSGKLMMEWLGFQDVADRIEYAVSSVLADGKVRTVDIGGKSGTVEVGDAVAALLDGDSVVDVVDIGLVDEVPVEG